MLLWVQGSAKMQGLPMQHAHWATFELLTRPGLTARCESASLPSCMPWGNVPQLAMPMHLNSSYACIKEARVTRSVLMVPRRD